MRSEVNVGHLITVMLALVIAIMVSAGYSEFQNSIRNAELREDFAAQTTVITNMLTATEGPGQFNLGVYWGLQAINESIAQRKNASVNELVARAHQLRAHAVLQPITNAPAVTNVPTVPKKRKKFLGIF